MATFDFDDTLDKQINVSVEYGETVAFDQSAKTHDGRLILYILVRDTVNEPISTLNQIAEQVYTLLDLQGTSLDSPDIVYWIQKLDTDFTHIEDLHYYELGITFRFVLTNN